MCWRGCANCARPPRWSSCPASGTISQLEVPDIFTAQALKLLAVLTAWRSTGRAPPRSLGGMQWPWPHPFRRPVALPCNASTVGSGPRTGWPPAGTPTPIV
jgi:hypothetical protein